MLISILEYESSNMETETTNETVRQLSRRVTFPMSRFETGKFITLSSFLYELKHLKNHSTLISNLIQDFFFKSYVDESVLN